MSNNKARYTSDLIKKKVEMVMKEKNYELKITASEFQSTDPKFDIDNLGWIDPYNSKVVNVYFQSSDGHKIYRQRQRGEKKFSNRTLPYLVCQCFEKQLLLLSEEERLSFPLVRYRPMDDMFKGIYKSIDEGIALTKRNIGWINYLCHNGEHLVLQGWNMFSTLYFTQECLRRFGQEGDYFVLIYKYSPKDSKDEPKHHKKDNSKENVEKNSKYILPLSHDVIQSKNMILHGAPGTGKTYLAKQIASDIVSQGQTIDMQLLDDVQKQRISFVQFHPSYDYSDFVEGLRPVLKEDGTMGFALKEGIFKAFVKQAQKDHHPYVFIIDEINRGELSKIFGELFFAIDPGYRGKHSTVTTQYANLHAIDDSEFYIPDNVYIIGTMNDIDRSVEPFDFAMRRRFRFIKLLADEHVDMLNALDDKIQHEALQRMSALNQVIMQHEELGEAYCIGAAYFSKLADITFEQLWHDYLKPLLTDYVQGLYEGQAILMKCEAAYFLNEEVRNDLSS